MPYSTATQQSEYNRLLSFFFPLLAEWSVKDLSLLLKNFLNLENQMRAYFVMYAMNAAVQKAGLLFHPWKKKIIWIYYSCCNNKP